MFRKMWCAAVLAAAMLPAHAQDATREEVRQLQQRVDELERRAQETPGRPQTESAFNPAVSAILNGVYANLSQDPNTYRLNGFVPTMGDVSPGKRGFSLGESELGISANVDHLFRGTLIAAIQPDGTGVAVEEAYLQTLALSRGFSVKAGRFFSAVGYQNQIHAHAWDFTDQPLVMKAFLGGQLNEDGVQMKWVAPTEFYFDLGAEFARGRAFPASDPNKNGAGSFNWFTHLGGDVGESLAWQAGMSYYVTSPRDRVYEDPVSGVSNSFTGSSRLWAASGVLKWEIGRAHV